MGGGSATILPAKRPVSSSSTEIVHMTDPANPNPKLHPKRAKKKPPPNHAADLAVPTGHASFRLLCHSSRIGGVIGKSGAVIKGLQLATAAKIRVETSPAEAPDRVVTVVALAGATSRFSLRSQFGGGGGEETAEVTKAQEALLRVFDRILEVAAESGAVGAGGFGVVSCRLLADAAGAGAVIGKGGKIVERIRKETGTKIKIFKENLPSCAASTDEMIEIEGDVLAVKKALVSVSQCLQDCFLANKTRAVGSKSFLANKTRAVGSKHVDANPLGTLPDVHVDYLAQRHFVIPTLTSSSNSISFPGSSVSYASGVYPLMSLEAERVPTLTSKAQPRDVVFKILCSNDKVGGVIGKGGSVVKALQNESGATISVGGSVAESDDRLITITASEDPDSRYSPAQKAVVMVFSKSEMESGSSKSPPITARLVVPSNQVGCILGKGGVIISEIRKATGANIRILGSGDQLPKCLSANDEVVQISGGFSSVQDALYNVTGRLRDNVLSSTVSSIGTRSVSSLLTETSPYGKMNGSSLITDTDPYGRIRKPGPLVFATSEPPLYDSKVSPSIGVTNSLNRHTTLPQNSDHLGPAYTFDRPPSPRQYNFDRPPSPRQYNFERPPSPRQYTYDRPPSPRQYTYDRPPSPRQYTYDRPPSPRQYTYDRPPSPRQWASQMVSGVDSTGIPEFGRGLTSLRGGLELGSGNKSAFVTNTTVEIIVPEKAIGSVYGDNGNNLARLRQISGARVIVHEPRPGISDRVIVISGTPDETQAAQSLLHAFILTGPS